MPIIDCNLFGRIMILIALFPFLKIQTAYAEANQYSIFKPVEQELGLRRVSMNQVGDSLELNVKVQTEGRCHFGDLNAIAMELIYSAKQPKLLLSVEPFLTGDRSFQPIVEDITSHGEKVTKGEGFTSKLLLPKVEDPQLVGLYLCKSTGPADNQCNNKDIKEMHEILRTHMTRGPNAAKLPKNKQEFEQLINKNREAAAKDKIYFSKFLLIENDAVTISEKAFNVDSYKVLSDYLRIRTKLAKKFSNVFERLEKLDKALSSVPLKGDQNSVTIILPHLDNGKCG